MSTAEVYAFCAERAISARILMNLSMDQKLRSVYKLLFIYTVINYNVFDTMCYAGGRIVNRRNEVLAETGGAVSALTPS
ncbi:hypothetical protein ABI57_18100 [Salmonella enterica subsp. enterica serovar Veneziana]|nr:hypothetical protein ABI57_18100 [Salmonella enterica subsp. enterica serovar Veneziana]